MSSLLNWYDRHRRRLPWRENPTPWRVLVSEAMLQQTTVKVVVPYFERFLSRWPSPAEMAAADVDDILAAWAGLGYYRRARSLHAAARVIHAEHGGRVPPTVEALRSLPGVGPYTAAAVASIAFGQRAAVVDGNVERVLSRLGALNAPGKKEYWARAEARLDADRPGDHNQAMMELGAIVCAPRAPRCDACPLVAECAAHASGEPTRWPTPIERKPIRRVEHAAVWARARGRTLLRRRPADGRLAGMWELPTITLDGASATGALQSWLIRECVDAASVGPETASVRHSILDERITLRVHPAELGRRRTRDDRWRWTTDDELERLALTTATKKALKAVHA